MPKYKDRTLQKVYDTMLALAADRTSELYHNNEPHGGAGHRAAFWDGYSGKFTYTGPKRSAHVVPGTPSAACFMAGKEHAKTKPRPSYYMVLIEAISFSDQTAEAVLEKVQKFSPRSNIIMASVTLDDLPIGKAATFGPIYVTRQTGPGPFA